jgi:hypothetical protein
MEPGTLLFVTLVGIVGFGLLWFRVLRPFCEDMGWISAYDEPATDTPSPRGAASPVNDYADASTVRYVQLPRTALANTQANTGLSAGLSAGLPTHETFVPAAVRNIMLDTATSKDDRKAATSRESLITALVAAGWGTGEIRAQLKGDSGEIGNQVRAARAVLGLVDEEVPRTPIAGRPVAPGVEFADVPLREAQEAGELRYEAAP